MCDLGARYIQNFPTFRTRVIMYRLFCRNTKLLLYSVLFLKNDLFLVIGYSFFSHPLSIWATGFLITHTIVDIWQNLCYNLRGKRKEKHIY